MVPAGFVPSAEDVEREIEAEFRDDVREGLNSIQVQIENLRSGAVSGAETARSVRNITGTLRAQAPSGVLPGARLVLQRLDDYLGPLNDLKGHHVDDVLAFTDRLEQALEGNLEGPEATAQMVRELPLKRGFDIDFEVIIPRPVEVLLILRDRAGAHLVERELAACGLRSTNVRIPFDAFEQAYRAKPDLIIAGMELGEMTGVDLACAFTAMPPTRAIPFALLTSYKWGHPALRELPPRAALLKKGTAFGDDLALALSRFGIL
ncbi:DNA-binding response regulator [Roseospira visakhapatnamensis]|uniref:CheY-like chemotaxis protein n=1 Tax=Roseospira visakhapatnamensis TaxID=390880 RepID=A0A7W6RAL1_9PROT|nr:DNA-binding response regulator [Roseospira visakhapatnamensis]MBB4265015.1 CheY-like chemotaxis protein [Roseospira visakhapatnamensis]